MRIILVVVFFASAYLARLLQGVKHSVFDDFSDNVPGTNNVLDKDGDDNDVVNDVADDDNDVSDDVDYDDNDDNDLSTGDLVMLRTIMMMSSMMLIMMIMMTLTMLMNIIMMSPMTLVTMCR